MSRWISQNLTWLLGIAGGALMGFAAGQIEVTAIKARLVSVESRLDAHDKFTERLCRIEAVQGIGECKR